jgi:MFS family permease
VALTVSDPKSAIYVPNAFFLGTMALGVVEFVTMLSVVIRVDEGRRAKPRDGRSWLDVAREAWGTDVLGERSFLWLLGSRFFVLVGGAMLVSLATFYLHQTFGLTAEATGRTQLAILGVVSVGVILAVVPAGRLSDRIGRKPVILGGCLIAAVTYVPLYQAMMANANIVYDSAGKITGANPNVPIMIALVWIQIIYVTMVYGPIAAFLVEFFPTRARYTSLSIPYHLGNGEFGGWLPTIYLSLVAASIAGAGYIPFLGLFDMRFLNPSNDPNGNVLAGLIYTIGVALITAVVGWLFIPETKDRRIWDEVQAEEVASGLKAGDAGALSG